jgi:hypothetical protein
MSLALTERPKRRLVSFTPRLDLRTGLTAAVRASTEGDEDDIDAFAAMAGEALTLWRVCKRTAPLAVSAPSAALRDPTAFDGLLRELGGDPQRIILELDERTMDEAGLQAARRLRARRWNLALHTGNKAPLALDARDRSLFGEYLVDVSAGLPAFVGLFLADRTPLSLRLQAAKASGAAITALGIDDHLSRRRAFQIGFDRGETDPARSVGRAL